MSNLHRKCARMLAPLASFAAGVMLLAGHALSAPGVGTLAGHVLPAWQVC
jgi:hypothetical protein